MDLTVQASCQTNSKGFAFHMFSQKSTARMENGHEHHMGSLCSQCCPGLDPDLITRRRG